MTRSPSLQRVRLVVLLFAGLFAGLSPAWTCSVSELLSMLQMRSKARQEEARDLLLFVDESLARPVVVLSKLLEKEVPGLKVRREISTTKEALRKICDLGRCPDLLLVSDGKLAEEWLVPRYAPTYVQFAKDEMVLAHTASSPRRTELAKWTWFQICLDPKVSFGMVDPMHDPAGYRSWIVARLCDRKYARGKGDSLSKALLAAARPENRRPSVMGMVRLLEAGRVDYALLYKSVVQSMNMPYFPLPDSVSLAIGTHSWSPAHYFATTVEVPGRRPQMPYTVHGSRVLHSAILPNEAAHPDMARRFLRLLLGKEGHAVMAQHGLEPVLWGAYVYQALFGKDIGATPEDRARLRGYGIKDPSSASPTGVSTGVISTVEPPEASTPDR